MKRREAIRSVVLISAGAAFLYQCKEKAASISLKQIPLTGAEQEMINELTEFIIPKTDFPGARDLKTGDFVLMMADDILSPEEQAKFEGGMKVFTGKGFAKMSPEERNEFVNALEGDPKTFYEMVKQGTIENFTSSEKYLKEVRNVTDLVPSKFQACIPVNS
ncbi:MAG: gluconate 2-dehydrogenase subunit 3 family protein [Bacteroidota bacterium]